MFVNLGWDKIVLLYFVFEGDTIYSRSMVLIIWFLLLCFDVGIVIVKIEGYN